MSKKQQAEKNMELSVRLADYIAENPDVVKNIPANSSYVVFSAKNKELNELNTKLAKSLTKEGKHVIKAEETKRKEDPWKFTSIAP